MEKRMETAIVYQGYIGDKAEEKGNYASSHFLYHPTHFLTIPSLPANQE